MKEIKQIYTYRLNPLWKEGKRDVVKYLVEELYSNYVKTMWKVLEYDWDGEDITKIKGTDIESKEYKDILSDLVFYFNLTEDFLYRYKDYLNWNCVCTYQTLSEDFITYMKKYIKWNTLLENQNLSEEFLRKNINWFEHKHWYHLSMNRKIRLSDQFLRECANELEWTYISTYYHFSDDFLREMNEKIWYRHFSYNAEKEFNNKRKKEFLLPKEDIKQHDYIMLKDVIYR